MNSLYLHIPFCVRKCHYCSFSSLQGQEALYDRYHAALLRDIKTRHTPRHGIPLTTLFLGGGTPTVLNPEQLSEILAVCRAVYGIASGAEVSIEANPGSVDLSALACLRLAGFNRLSLGVQSFLDDDLVSLGRIHGAADAERAFRDARMAGFTNVSLDLMYGLPGQSPGTWQKNLERALSLQPEHLSLYELTIEEGTGFAKRFNQGRLTLPDEEAILEMDEITTRLCASHGFTRYEISNYAQTGCECRHNLVYWNNEPYLACGAGAVCYCQGVRSRFVEDPSLYCRGVEENETIVVESEKLDHRAAFRESVVMGLRLVQGVSEKRLLERFKLSFVDVYGQELSTLVESGLLQYENMNLRLTSRGRQVANTVMAELV